jgi:hypothetical protein
MRATPTTPPTTPPAIAPVFDEPDLVPELEGPALELGVLVAAVVKFSTDMSCWRPFELKSGVRGLK